jgi:hypothetical protein
MITAMTTANAYVSFSSLPSSRSSGHRGNTPLITSIAVFCLIFLSISGQFAMAGSYTGSDFKKDCIQYEHMQRMTGDFSARDAGFCLGYFSAVLENATGFCLPQDARKREIHKKMAQFLSQATELLDLDASEVILTGLKENFPCHGK